MRLIKAFLVFVGLLAGSVGVVQGDCENYIEIVQPIRSANYSLGPLEQPLCDSGRFTAGSWYRFNSNGGSKLAQGCVEYGQCGTQGPIWMDGLHPTAADGVVERTVCANYGSNGDCCAWSATIQVLSCNDLYFVYKLANPPGCHVAYCTDGGRVCSDDKIWSPQLLNCIEQYPAVIDAWIRTRPNSSTTNEAGFDFMCEFYVESNINATNNNDICVEVTLLFDAVEDIKIPKKKECFASDIFYQRILFPGIYLKGHMGKNVDCQIRSYWQEFSGNTNYWSPHLSSSYSQATGLTVQNYPTDLVLNSSTDIRTIVFNLDAIIPVKCLDQTKCPTANIVTKEEQIVHTCQVVLDSTNTASFSVQVSRKSVPGQYIHRFDLNFPVIVTEAGTIFDGYILPLSVIVDNSVGVRRCHSFADPTFIDFDNELGGGRVMNIGDFYMWKIMDESVNFEVQARHTTCILFGSCTCAVAIREGNDIIGVDACDSRPLRIIRYLQSSSDADVALPTVTSSWGTTRVTMPSGRELILYTRSFGISMTFLNVELSVPASDTKFQSTGLCGNNNDIQDEVFDYESNNLHRVPADSIIFNGFYECIDTNQTAYFCECNSDGSLNCGNKSLPIRTTGETCVNNRGKRSVEKAQLDEVSDDYIGPDELYYNFEYDINATFIPPSWPTPAGKTRIQVESECERILTNSPVYERCQNYTNVDMLLEACVLDTQATDSWDFAHGMLLEFQSQCKAMIQDRSPAASEDDLVQDDVTGEWTTKLALQLLQDVCPSICLNGGTCRNRTCICMHGFSGETCAVETNKAPEMVGLQGGGLCDVRQRSCQKTRVFANNLLNSPGLTCRAVVASSQTPLLSTATYYQDEELACHHAFSSVLLPGRGGDVTEAPSTHQTLHLSITNDKSMYSNTLNLTIYDSLCMRCFSDHTCIPLNDACNIGGRCYRHMETHPGDSSLYCDATSSTTTWSEAEASDKCCAWDDWQECSREHCLRKRVRVCQTRTCLENFEMEWCHECTTTELPEQIDQGLVLLLALEKSNQILQKLDSIAVGLAEIINKYCTKNTEECCELMQKKALHGDVDSVTLTSGEHIRLAQGFPKRTQNELFSMKWLAYLWEVKAMESCQVGSAARRKRQSAVYGPYIPTQLLYKAASTYKSDLEQTLNAQIYDIHASNINDPGPDALTLSLAIVLPVVTMIIVGLVVCIYCKTRNQKKTRTACYENKSDADSVIPNGVRPMNSRFPDRPIQTRGGAEKY